jgi:hypothetical protein
MFKGYVDPEEIFSAIFGGERFVPIIGDISLGKDMKEALQKAEEVEEIEDSTPIAKDAKGREILTPEQKAKREEQKAKKEALEKQVNAEVRKAELYLSPRLNFLLFQKAKAREERIQKLVEQLERKLSIYVESATGPNDQDVGKSWREICRLEAE